MSHSSRDLEAHTSGSSGLKSKLEIIHPQHPLPEEIRKLRREETVCRYCGVSYLIHNEIKALENKLQTLQSELEKYHGIDEREKQLQKDLDNLQYAHQQTHIRLDTANNLISKKEQEIEHWIGQGKELEQQLQSATKSLRTRHHQMLEKLKCVATDIAGYRNLVNNMKEDAENFKIMLMNESLQITVVLKDICKAPMNENASLRSRMEHLLQENSVLQSHVEVLEGHLKKRDEDVVGIEHVKQKMKELEDNCGCLQTQIEDAKRNLIIANRKNHELSSVNEDAKQEIGKLKVDLELLQTQLRNQHQTLEMTISSLTKDMKEKERLLSISEKEMRELRVKLFHQQKNEAEMMQRASLTEGRLVEMQKCLEKAGTDVEAFKREREMIITAHCDEIEQLRNILNKKLAEVDQSWPKKLEEAMELEKEKQTNEMNLLEKKLQENFTTEMQNEKKRHQKQLDREVKDREVKVNSVIKKNKSELLKLESQLIECKSQATETETMLQQEVAHLKEIIQQLELKLDRYDEESERKITQLQMQLLSAQNDLSRVEVERGKLVEALQSAKDEVVFLYDTVRRECEERNELTEVLNIVQTELLTCKKLARGFSARRSYTDNLPGLSSRNVHSPTSVSSTLASIRTSKTLSFDHSGQATVRRKAVLQPLAIPSQNLQAFETGKEQYSQTSTSTSGTVLDCEGEQTKLSGKLKGCSMLESCRRLQPINGKK